MPNARSRVWEYFNFLFVSDLSGIYGLFQLSLYTENHIASKRRITRISSAWDAYVAAKFSY